MLALALRPASSPGLLVLQVKFRLYLDSKPCIRNQLIPLHHYAHLLYHAYLFSYTADYL
jgi:hypothetical protein